jgi:hypothetical protein
MRKIRNRGYPTIKTYLPKKILKKRREKVSGETSNNKLWHGICSW